MRVAGINHDMIIGIDIDTAARTCIYDRHFIGTHWYRISKRHCTGASLISCYVYHILSCVGKISVAVQYPPDCSTCISPLCILVRKVNGAESRS